MVVVVVVVVVFFLFGGGGEIKNWCVEMKRDFMGSGSSYKWGLVGAHFVVVAYDLDMIDVHCQTFNLPKSYILI